MKSLNKPYLVLVRLMNQEDVEFRFTDFQSAYDEFKSLVFADMDGIFTLVWHVTLMKGKSVLRNYSHYKN